MSSSYGRLRGRYLYLQHLWTTPPATRSSLNSHKRSKLSITAKSEVSSVSVSLAIIPSNQSLSLNLDIWILYLPNTTWRTPTLRLLPSKKAQIHSATSRCKELTSSLNQHAVFTRPDIAFANSKLSKFNANSTSTSKPRFMFYNTSNQLAIIVLSTNVHRRSQLPIVSSAIQMRTSPVTRTTENPTLRVYCQRRGNNLVNSQLTSNSLLHSLAIARKQFFHELQIPSAFVL